jgi:hypothetical protein
MEAGEEGWRVAAEVVDDIIGSNYFSLSLD